MGTAERREASEDGAAAGGTALRDPVAPEDDSPNGQVRTERSAHAANAGRSPDRGPTAAGADSSARQRRVDYRPLWVEETAKRRRMPDPVRTAAVRAVLVIAVTLIQAMVAFLCTLAGSWLAFPMVISSVVSTVLATWGALDVWVTRQVWNQRNGVVSTPSSTARALRREQRRARRQERTVQRAQERILRQSGAGQLSHP
ncbi:hypothetical protein PYK79_08910 [Streptomyces sp. ID05-04B]|uniref:hypothetical protein n=1 Tax=unclassified Streptomyces TaxID=2593676 RepID=UPI000D1A21D6|nr:MULTISPECIES: hypothetical protein [unclassified Streptomyces]AVV43788.1 hypothetical protein C6376_22345 [Streptomyces sp. P3]MDX5563380.1 hypothetical protein [Streptomyces sp. ID05-04B]